MTPARWNMLATFVIGLAIGIFGAGFGMNLFLTKTEIEPRQKKIDDLYVKNIELEGDRDKWLGRAYETSVRPR